MSAEFAIRLAGVGKFYPMFTQPEDRLKQLLVRGKRRYYQEYWALQDVTLDILKGESVGIIGRNGAGKSTFLQLVCGTLRPSTGSIEVEGRIAAMLELGAGFNPEFTGQENVHLAAAVLGLSADLIKERYPSIAEFAGIGDFIDRPVKYYSSGMYARLAFAVAAHVDADILVVDEILAVGDAAFQQKCMRFIHAFREPGRCCWCLTAPTRWRPCATAPSGWISALFGLPVAQRKCVTIIWRLSAPIRKTSTPSGLAAAESRRLPCLP